MKNKIENRTDSGKDNNGFDEKMIVRIQETS